MAASIDRSIDDRSVLVLTGHWWAQQATRLDNSQLLLRLGDLTPKGGQLHRSLRHADLKHFQMPSEHGLQSYFTVERQ